MQRAKICLFLATIERKHMGFGQELFDSQCSSLHYRVHTQADTQAIHIHLSNGAHACVTEHMLIESGDAERRNLFIPRHHRKHMCFWPERIKRRCSSQHCRANTQVIHICLCIGAYVHRIW
jgi:hypothetical protein